MNEPPQIAVGTSAPAFAVGIACGTGAAVAWALGLVAARHGVTVGLTPTDLALHRFVWAGLALLPIVWRRGIVDLYGIGWQRGAALTIFGGPPLAIVSYAGFLLVPLGHGGLIQPSCAVFGMLLRLWRIEPTRAAAVVSVLALADIPIHWAAFGFERMVAVGVRENLLQALMQGVFAGPLAIYLFTRSVVLLGAARAAVFPSLVPGFTLLIGFVTLIEVPSAVQLLGLGIVLIGFRLTQGD